MSEPQQDDPRAMDDEQLAEVPDPPQPDGQPGQGPVVEDGYAEGGTNAPDGAERPEPAGEDYAGSGF